MNKQTQSTKDTAELAQDATATETTATAATAADEAVVTDTETTEVSVSTLQAEIKEVREHLQTAQDETVRAQAEVINIRRRAEQNVAKAHKFGQEKLVNELLPVLDNLGRAISACDNNNATVEAMREGVEMTQKMLVDNLAKFNVAEIDPLGQPFDPNMHEAITMIANPNMEPNTVVEVMHKGYSLNGRLVRPAMVIVSKS